MEIAILAAGAALALVGSLVQAFVARTYSRADRHRELLIEAYSDFLTGLAQRAANVKGDAEKAEAATFQLVIAQQKITAYAPAPVVTALATFKDTSTFLANADAQAAMISLVQAMRESVGVKADGLESAIRKVLFGGTAFV